MQLKFDFVSLYNSDAATISLSSGVIKTDIKIASSMGLLLTEILTNSLKYAFPENRKGVIKINCQDVNDSMLDSF